MNSDQSQLDDEIISRATQDLFAASFANAVEEAGGRFPAGCRINDYTPEHPAGAETIVRESWIPEIETSWKLPVQSVFDAMGLATVRDQADALYYLIMGCLGYGVGLWDDHSDELDRASEAIGRVLDAAPCHLESWPMDEVAQEYVEEHGLGELARHV